MIVHSQPSPDYRLVYFDDFNNPHLSDHDWGVSNCEDAYFDFPTKTDNENVYIETNSSPNSLVLFGDEEISDCDNNYNFTVAKLSSFTHLYGYFEIRSWLPGGCGALSSFWFWSGWNNTQYSEIDVYEHCSKDGHNIKATLFWDDNNNGISDYDNAKNSNDGPPQMENDGWSYVEDNISLGYHVYGFEWTPSTLRWFIDGIKVKEFPNILTHQPLSMILGIDFQDLFNCMTNCNFANGEFPRYHVIDWVKIYKKENSAIYLKSNDTEICIGQTTTILAPMFGDDAEYNWTFSPANSFVSIDESDWFGISAQEMQGFQGAWHKFEVQGLTPGINTVNLSITFPGGYVETKSILIKVLSNVPSPQSLINYELIEEPYCCYKFSTNYNPNATSYVWTFTSLSIGGQSYSMESTSFLLDECIPPGSYLVTVKAKNDCGLSTPYSQYINLPYRPLIDCEHNQGIQISPNPNDGQMTFILFNLQTNEPSRKIGGQLRVLDCLGITKYTTWLTSNPISLDLSFLCSGNYRIVYSDNTSLVSATIVIGK